MRVSFLKNKKGGKKIPIKWGWGGLRGFGKTNEKVLLLHKNICGKKYLDMAQRVNSAEGGGC